MARYYFVRSYFDDATGNFYSAGIIAPISDPDIIARVEAETPAVAFTMEGLIQPGELGELARLKGGATGQVPTRNAQGEVVWGDFPGLWQDDAVPTVGYANAGGGFSVDYIRRFMQYRQIGDWIDFKIDLAFTPNWGGSDIGNFFIDLDLPACRGDRGSYGVHVAMPAFINRGAQEKETLSGRISPGTSVIDLAWEIEGSGAVIVNSNHIINGRACSFLLDGGYVVSSS